MCPDAPNPLLVDAGLPHDAVPFDQIRLEHFLPALDRLIEDADAALDTIRSNNEPPTFENSVIALEEATASLQQLLAIYHGLAAAESDDQFKALAQEIGPKTSAFFNRLMLDPEIFARVHQVHENREGLDPESLRLTEVVYRNFVHGGALLDEVGKTRLREIDEELSQLKPRFSQNVLSAKNAFFYFTTDEQEIKGLPESARRAAAHAAELRGKSRGWAFTLQEPSVGPVMEYADHRALRERLYRARGAVAFGGEFDNREVVKRIAQLMHESAKLLGFRSHAALAMVERMAEKPAEVEAFLRRIETVAAPAARVELAELRAFAHESEGIEELQRWDQAYYARKLKEEKLALDEESLRPYFRVEAVVEGAFAVARKLYNLRFTRLDDVPVYHPDVPVYQVSDADGSDLGLLYLDLHPRNTKGGGAFTGRWRAQGRVAGKMHRSQVFIIANLTASTPDHPSLLTVEEVRIVFHEFGHALHGLLSDCTYTHLSSPSVYWDFVELPSQIMENWVTEPEALELFARHYETGAPIPLDLVRKIKESRKFLAGLSCMLRLQSEYLDWAWFSEDPSHVDDIEILEERAKRRVALFPPVPGCAQSTSFEHIFAANYAAGYYSYRWAEVLEADAFARFEEEGVFDRETALSFRRNILEQGNKVEPQELFRRFRGRAPDPDALLRRMGLM